MKQRVNQWFEQSVPFRGILGSGVRHSDRTTTARSWSDVFSTVAMDNVLRCVADIYQVLPMNGLPQGQLRLVYQSALLHCEWRSDGTCLAVFTVDDPEGYDAAELRQMFSDFRGLK
jgi:hypothetical protein